MRRRPRRGNLTQALFNLPPDDPGAGESGRAALPDRFDAFKTGLERALDYIEATGLKRVPMMAGNARRSHSATEASFRRAIRHAAPMLAARGVDLRLTPINSRDMPDYFLTDFNYTRHHIAELGRAEVKLQFDVHHRQFLQGEVAMSFRALKAIVGPVQAAPVPSRNEPDGEELNFAYLFAERDRRGHDGFVGCEYDPRGATRDGPGWFKPCRRS